MTAYAIEKGVPMPDRPARYPFRDMEIGDSFVVPIRGGEHREPIYRRRISAAASDFRKRTGLKWYFRTERDLDGLRVFRVDRSHGNVGKES